MTQEQLDRIADKLARPVAWVILKRWWFWAAFCSLLLALFGVSYPSLRAKVEEMVTSQIAERFAEPRIREAFQGVAENQASEILRHEIQPAVERFRADLQKEYQILSEEVSRVKVLNSLPIYGDKAILEGDKGALNELNRIAQAETEMNPLKKAAIEEIRRVKNWYYPGFALPERI